MSAHLRTIRCLVLVATLVLATDAHAARLHVLGLLNGTTGGAVDPLTEAYEDQGWYFEAWTRSYTRLDPPRLIRRWVEGQGDALSIDAWAEAELWPQWRIGVVRRFASEVEVFGDQLRRNRVQSSHWGLTVSRDLPVRLGAGDPSRWRLALGAGVLHQTRTVEARFGGLEGADGPSVDESRFGWSAFAVAGFALTPAASLEARVQAHRVPPLTLRSLETEQRYEIGVSALSFSLGLALGLGK